MSSQTLTLPDGRQLGYLTQGTGTPVVYFHGTASSRLETLLLKQLTPHGIQLIGVDRPGYGLSTFKNRSRLRDFAPDINALTEYLGIDKFNVLSWSGGGTFALAYAALNPKQINHVVAVGCPSLPFDPSTAHNGNPLVKFAMKNSLIAKFGLSMFRKSVFNANRDIEGYLESRGGKGMVADWPAADARFFSDPNWLRLMYGAVEEGFRQDGCGVKAVYQEHMLFLKPWSEPLEQIPKGAVTLWQGSQDKTCPTKNAHQLAKLLPDAKLEIFPNDGHCVMFAHTAKLAAALKP
ncbi:MAG: alpha/beta hydrolase [Candidatus Bathyarchaeota archaeon]|nr:alpha/beta hydrolase [Candidatus Bathyarchaeota archaeon]